MDVAYPVGPHSVVATLSDLLGIGIESAFLGFIIALPVIAGLTALAAFDHLPKRVRPIGAVVVGLGYLSAAYLAQASFKESVTALMVLAYTLVVREVVADRAQWRRWAVPALLLVFAGLSAFSVPALLWFIAIATAALLVTMVAERIRPTGRILTGVGVAIAAVVGSIVVFELLTSFFSAGPGRFALSASEGSRGVGAAGGNLFGPLSFFEALGVWPNLDFRFEPETDHWRLGVGLAVAATSVGVVRTALRREWVLLAATASTVAIYVLVSDDEHRVQRGKGPGDSGPAAHARNRLGAADPGAAASAARRAGAAGGVVRGRGLRPRPRWPCVAEPCAPPPRPRRSANCARWCAGEADALPRAGQLRGMGVALRPDRLSRGGASATDSGLSRREGAGSPGHSTRCTHWSWSVADLLVAPNTLYRRCRARSSARCTATAGTGLSPPGPPARRASC